MIHIQFPVSLFLVPPPCFYGSCMYGIYIVYSRVYKVTLSRNKTKKKPNLNIDLYKGMWTQPIFFVYASVQTIFAYRKINRAWVIKSNVCWKRVPKGRASGSKIDSEILPYLTGAINSSIMMLTIAEVTERTRRGQTACYTHFLPTPKGPVAYLSTASSLASPQSCRQVQFLNTVPCI